MKNFNMRLPDEIHERLVKAAAADKRSAHAEVLLFIEKGLDERDGKDAPGPTAGPRLTPP
ncbi:MAG TPA: Arc family DNA-binding protein [Arthrobacter sp.]|jgi:predicted HicB family RNase H-like nuclease|nr:Arc family DNA-binding protein [Arthrobacter sp.]